MKTLGLQQVNGLESKCVWLGDGSYGRVCQLRVKDQPHIAVSIIFS